MISPDAEMIWYGCVDVLAKPVFCFIHCRELAKCDYSRLGLVSFAFFSLSHTSTTLQTESDLLNI